MRVRERDADQRDSTTEAGKIYEIEFMMIKCVKAEETQQLSRSK